LGVELPSHLADKLASLDEKDGRIKVALVGGFSVGKTSLAAAWLGKPQRDMKISQAESSNSVNVYEVEGNIQLVDTPGLFGFKEKGIGSGEAEAYREMTRKYVSEADLLLYVLSPSNPLKESHREELNWLFRDLSLLPRTVFVIGSFDQVADLDNEDDFVANFAIKKENVTQRLRDLIDLTSAESEVLSVVAVSPNPFEEGPEYWAEHPDEFRKLSRIDDLKHATSRQLELAGGTEAVKAQTALSIVRDVVQRQMVPVTKAAQSALKRAIAASEKTKEEAPQLDRYKREATTAQLALRRWVLDYFTDLIIEAQNTGQDEFAEFFLRNIGEGGKVLAERVQIRFEEELGPISSQLSTMGVTFLEASSDWSWIGNIGKGAAGLGKSGIINNKSILAARDALGLSIKFKPYGAIKLASKASVALAAVGPAIEGALMIKKWWDQRKFQDTRKVIVSALKEQQDGLTETLNAPDFISVYFPQIVQMQALFEQIRQAEEEAHRYAEAIRHWAENGRELCNRFGIQAPDLPDESNIIDI
jgi:GTP-binding protein EngB required for normal cell division